MAIMIYASGCNDKEFLTEDPETFYTVDNIFSTAEQVDQVLATCYIKVKNIFCPYSNTGTDLTLWSYGMGNGTDVFDVPTIRYTYRFNDYSILTPDARVFRDPYDRFYSIIKAANTVIYAANKEGFTWGSEGDKNYAIAQARFFRAFAYRNLGELYGGVPLVTAIATTPRYDYVRASRIETYQYAIDELEAILNDLPLTTTVAGRLVKAAAQHNLCQLYIDKGVISTSDANASFAKALQYANDIIDGGTYSLMTERFGTRKDDHPEFYYASSVSDQTDDRTYTSAGYTIEGNLYWDLFQEGNQDYQSGNREAIWCAQADYAVFKTEGILACLDYPAIYGPVFRDQAQQNVDGMMEDVGGFGCSQITPTPHTRDGIYADKWGDDLRNSDAVFRRTVLGNVTSSEYYGKPVPWDVLYKVDPATGKGTDAAYTLLYPMSCKIAPDLYTMKPDGGELRRIFRDDYLIRLPETILLRAEVKYRMGDNDGAAADINLLRSRARCGYLVTSQDVNIDLILDERTRELIYEESRWNTLLRMGGDVAARRIKEYSYWDYPRVTLTNDFDVWPIPQTVIDTNKDVAMEQNAGWE